MTYRLTPDASTKHEDAREWYDSYGWYLSTDSAGDVTHDTVEYDWLDDESDDIAVEKLMKSLNEEEDDSGRDRTNITREEARTVVRKAREVREAAESICGLLDAAAEAYRRDDLDGVIEALDAAQRQESEHGASPGSDDLRAALLTEIRYTVRTDGFVCDDIVADSLDEAIEIAFDGEGLGKITDEASLRAKFAKYVAKGGWCWIECGEERIVEIGKC